MLVPKAPQVLRGRRGTLVPPGRSVLLGLLAPQARKERRGRLVPRVPKAPQVPPDLLGS